MLSAAARVHDQLEGSSFHCTASQRGQANKKRNDGRVGDKGRDSTINGLHCAPLSVSIFNLRSFFKDKPWRNRLLIISHPC